MAFIFDINYKTSFKIIEKEKYIDRIVNRFNFTKEPTRRAIESMRKLAEEYVLEKI